MAGTEAMIDAKHSGTDCFDTIFCFTWAIQCRILRGSLLRISTEILR